ncbi:MAG: Gfo/Idh/MocA family oxidoreductase [Verrucomicrobiae bacterium]
MKINSSTRREFLGGMTKVMLASAAAPLFLPSRLFGQEAPSNKLNLAIVGTGGIVHSHLPVILAPDSGVNVAALCDVNLRNIQIKRGNADFKEGLAKAKDYQDYRKLLEEANSFDAVLIATGCRWHVPLCKTFIKAGKHVYCEKPLARLVGEARDLSGLLSDHSHVVTQLGTQGTNTETFRRSVEVIQSGLLGSIREVHLWFNCIKDRSASHGLPEGEDPIPEYLNWDEWLGPAPMRPYKKGLYDGVGQWYVWYDFSSAYLNDFGQHNFMMPVRALDLEPPVKVAAEASEPSLETAPATLKVRFDFAAKGNRAPLSLYWYECGLTPPSELFDALPYKAPSSGCLFVGDKGMLWADGWGRGGVMRLKDEQRWRSVLDHEAAKPLPKTQARAPKGGTHFGEFAAACKGNGKTYTPLQEGAKASEVLLPGIVSTRLGMPIEWDGKAMKVPGHPEADRFIHPNYRTKWLV